jgi:hypothetical protein
MVNDDSYDLMPHRQINEIKAQIAQLKAMQDRASPKELIASMDSLTNSITSMLNLFQKAAQELKYEIKEEQLASGKESVNEKLDKIIDQNRIIANGMIAVSDMVKDFSSKRKTPTPARMPAQFKQQMPVPPPNFQQPVFNPQSSPQPNFNPAPPMFDQNPMPDLEPPKFDEPKKKGLFGMFQK